MQKEDSKIRAQVLAETKQLVQQAARNLSGDLDGEQVQLYDLAFCQAEIAACDALSVELESGDPLSERAAALFVAETVLNTRNRLSMRPKAYDARYLRC